MKRYAPPPPRPPEITLGQIPGGFRGTQKTIAHMRSLIREGVKDFYVRQKAIDILLERGVKPKDYLGEIKALASDAKIDQSVILPILNHAEIPHMCRPIVESAAAIP